MRKANSIAAAAVMILFVFHLIWGAMELFGMIKGGSTFFRIMTYTLIGFVALHTVFGIVLTADTVRAMRRAGVSYYKENRLFWIRRISGFALMAFIIVHVILFHGQNSGGIYYLTLFGIPELVSQILMVAALLIHIAANIRPMRIAFGFSDKWNIRTDIALVLSILLLLAGIAFIIYFLRWAAV